MHTDRHVAHVRACHVLRHLIQLLLFCACAYAGLAHAQSPCQEDGSGSSECTDFRLTQWDAAVSVSVPPSCIPPHSTDDQSARISLEGALRCAYPGACSIGLSERQTTNSFGFNNTVVATTTTFDVDIVTGSLCSGHNTDVAYITKNRKQTCPASATPTSAGGAVVCARGLTYPERCEKCSAGNPIVVQTGNKWQDEVDYRAGDLSFVRSYNSQGVFTPRGVTPAFPLGPVWVHNYDRRLYTYVGLATTLAGIVRADGTTRYFRLQSNGSWLARSDDPDRLSGSSTSGWTYTNANDEVETYDVGGKLTSLRLRSGVVLSLSYSDSSTSTSIAPYPGLLIKVIDSFGHELNFTYNGAGRIVTFTDPAGGLFQYEYDGTSSRCTLYWGCGALTAVTYPDGKKRTYVYNESVNTSSLDIPNALTGIIDENNTRFATFKYNSSSQASSTEHAGTTQKYTLNGIGNAFTSVVDPLGTNYGNNFSTVAGVRRLTQRSQPCAGCFPGTSTATYSYDTLGNLVSETDFNANTTCYANDTSRNLQIAKIQGAPNGSNCTTLLAATTLAAPMRKTSTDWHATYRVAKRVAEPFRITTHSYNGDPGVSCAPSGASVGLICSRSVQPTTDISGALGFTATTTGTARTWTYTYDAFGRTLTVDGPRTDVTDDTTYAYYANDPSQGLNRGMLHTVTDALGHATTFSNYNAHKQPQTITDANSLVTTLVYDSRMRLSSSTRGSETPS